MLGGETHQRRRRTVLKHLGGAVVVVATGVSTAGCISGTAQAQVDAGLTVEDRTMELDDPAVLEDVRLTGNITGSYDASNVDAEVGRVEFRIAATYEQSEGESGYDDPTIRKDIEVGDVDPVSDTIERDIDFSLMREQVPAGHWKPDYGGRTTRSLRWSFLVECKVYEAGGSETNRLGFAQATDEATVTIDWAECHPDDDSCNGSDDDGQQDANAEVSGDLTFEIVTN